MEIVYSEVIERMKDIGKLKNDSAVARVLGVTPQALSNYKKRAKMPAHLIIKFAESNSLSVDWLLSGEGAPRRAEDGSYIYGVEEESSRYGKEVAKAMGLANLSAEEMMYIGKLLKVLRSGDTAIVTALMCSIDAFLEAAAKIRQAGSVSVEEGGQV